MLQSKIVCNMWWLVFHWPLLARLGGLALEDAGSPLLELGGSLLRLTCSIAHCSGFLPRREMHFRLKSDNYYILYLKCSLYTTSPSAPQEIIDISVWWENQSRNVAEIPAICLSCCTRSINRFYFCMICFHLVLCQPSPQYLLSPPIPAHPPRQPNLSVTTLTQLEGSLVLILSH